MVALSVCISLSSCVWSHHRYGAAAPHSRSCLLSEIPLAVKERCPADQPRKLASILHTQHVFNFWTNCLMSFHKHTNHQQCMLVYRIRHDSSFCMLYIYLAYKLAWFYFPHLTIQLRIVYPTLLYFCIKLIVCWSVFSPFSMQLWCYWVWYTE